MQALPTAAEVLAKMVAWADANPAIRAMILTSSLVRPGGPVDVLTDYDLILAVTDAFPTGWESAWLSDYGEPMVRWGDEGEMMGVTTYFRGVIYQDYVKIDYSIWPETLLTQIAASPTLSEELNEGYRVLLDKDSATAGWKLPTHKAFIPACPTQEEYQALVEEVWWGATYVAKSLWRDELAFARWVLFTDIHDESLRRMLEWQMEINHDWSVRPGVHGRRLKALLPAETWSELTNAYRGQNLEECWESLWRTIILFRRVAGEVANNLGLVYPQTVDDQVSRYLQKIQRMPPSA